MNLDVRTILLLLDPTRRRVLLLRRSPTKKLFPGLITGIGGAVELKSGEHEDLAGSVLRELREETRIDPASLQDLRLRLSTIQTRADVQIVLLWFTAILRELPPDLSCTEGELRFFDRTALPLEEMIPTARAAIPFVLSLPEDDPRAWNGVFDADGTRVLAR